MFIDRKDAGIKLAEKLKDYKDKKEVIVLALPRGGVVTGYEIAGILNAPFDVLIVRKIGHPMQPELAAGAVSETGTVVLIQRVISFGVSEDYIKDETSRQKEEISRRIKLYRKGQGLRDITGKIIVLVDDGVATGATIKAAISTLNKEKIKKLVIALPVAPPDTADELKQMADEFVCLEIPRDFMAVGSYYHDFTQITDQEVVKLLESAEESYRKKQLH